MPTIRERMTRLFLGRELDKINLLTADLVTAYRERPYLYAQSPEDLITRLGEVDPQLIDVLLRQIRDAEVSPIGDEMTRVTMVKEARSLAVWDVVTKRIISLWKDYAFATAPAITPLDPDAQSILDEFLKSPQNKRLFGARSVGNLSDMVLTDGEIFFVFFVSTLDGSCIVRTIPTEEITEIICDPEDKLSPWLYKRNVIDNGASQEIYYRDWLADPKKAETRIPQGAQKADHDGTAVVVLHCAHNTNQGSLRGWPLITPGSNWSRAYRNFLQDRAAVNRAAAMLVEKVKVKGGSRAVDAVRARLESSLVNSASSTGIEQNPKPAAGSTWVENEALSREWMNRPTGATDAEKDGAPLLAQAGLAGNIYPHYLGRGESFRLATACYSADTEVLTKTGWKLHSALTPSDLIGCFNSWNCGLVFERAMQIHRYDYNGMMKHLSGRATDALVTPNHKMVIVNRNNVGKPWEKTALEARLAESLPSRFAIPTQVVYGENEGKTIDLFSLPDSPITIEMGDWLSFLGWWIAEGWLEGIGSVGVCQSVQSEDYQPLSELLGRLPFKFSLSKSFSRTDRWRVVNHPLYNWLSENCGKGQAERKVPGFIFDLPARLIRKFIDALWAGDGHSTDGGGFLTSISKRLLDDVQRLLIQTGEWGNISLSYGENEKTSETVKTNHACYVLNRHKQHLRDYSRRKAVTDEQYQGEVWCLTVPTGYYITRRNGKALIAGNSAMETPMLRTFNGYQNWWGSVWQDIVTLVLTQAEKYGKLKFETKDCKVNQSNILDPDLNQLSVMLGQVDKAVTDMVISQETGEIICLELIRVFLQTIGIDNVDDIIPPLEPEENAEAATSTNPFAEVYNPASYEQGIRRAVYGLWSAKLTYSDFYDAMSSLIDRALQDAWFSGAKQVGLDPEDLTPDELSTMYQSINQENTFIPGLAQYVIDNSKAAGKTLGGLDVRIGLWSRRWQDVENLAKSMASNDPKEIWVLGPVKTEHCFPKGTPVLTINGYKSIEKIAIGELVHTTDGYRKVDRLYSSSYTGTMQKIRTGSGKEITSTSNHRFLTGRGWVRADELLINDKIVRLQDCGDIGGGYISLPYSFDDVSASGEIFILSSIPSPLSNLSISKGSETTVTVPIFPINLNDNIGFNENINHELIFYDMVRVVEDIKSFENCMELLFKLSRLGFSLYGTRFCEMFFQILSTLVRMLENFGNSNIVKHWIVFNHITPGSDLLPMASFNSNCYSVFGNDISNVINRCAKKISDFFCCFSGIERYDIIFEVYTLLCQNLFSSWSSDRQRLLASDLRDISTFFRAVFLSDTSNIINGRFEVDAANWARNIFENSSFVPTYGRAKQELCFTGRNNFSGKFSSAILTNEVSDHDKTPLLYDNVISITQLYTNNEVVHNIGINEIPNYIAGGFVVHNCGSCSKLAGKVKRASQWRAAGLGPQSGPMHVLPNPALECGGYECKCSLMPTTEPMSKGRLPAVANLGKKSKKGKK